MHYGRNSEKSILTSKIGVVLAAALAIAACDRSSGGSSSPEIPSTVSAEAWTRITQGLDSFLQQLEALDEYPPGTAVVVVT